jgi:hypothetical protein
MTQAQRLWWTVVFVLIATLSQRSENYREPVVFHLTIRDAPAPPKQPERVGPVGNLVSNGLIPLENSRSRSISKETLQSSVKRFEMMTTQLEMEQFVERRPPPPPRPSKTAAVGAVIFLFLIGRLRWQFTLAAMFMLMLGPFWMLLYLRHRPAARFDGDSLVSTQT